MDNIEPSASTTTLPVSDSDANFVVRGLSLRHDLLLREYQKFRGDTEGKNLLSSEFLHIYEEARKRANVAEGSFTRASGEGMATTRTATDAEALCEATLMVLAERNQSIRNRRVRKSLAMAISAIEPVAGSQEVRVPALMSAMDEATDLVRRAGDGEIWLSDAVYRALPEARRQPYARVEPVGGLRMAQALLWRRSVGNPGGPRSPNQCVMCVDMARSSDIQAKMELIWGGDGGAAAVLQDQITTILRDGFTRANIESFDGCIYKFGGDGGIFLFDDVAQAHAVGVEILKRAEEHNARARIAKYDDGMRCFRIGIDYGPLETDANGEYSGKSLVDATRLESGGPTGEIRASEPAYQKLPKDLQKCYGETEPVPGKGHDEPIPARRYAVVPRSLWPETDNKGVVYPPPKVRQAAPRPVEDCFVIGPIQSSVKRVEEVMEQLIAPACERRRLRPRRAHEIPGDRREVISEHLGTAPLAVAYLGSPTNGWNVNVILEVGFRLATGMPLVILSEAMEDDSIPKYQELLPFQLANQNIITIGRDPAASIENLSNELEDSRTRRRPSDWDSPYPVLELKFTNIADATITDCNGAARALFGEEVVRCGEGIAKLRASLAERLDAISAEARRGEHIKMTTELIQRAIGLMDSSSPQEIPRARIPMIFQDLPGDPLTGKPRGFLPLLVRWAYKDGVIRARYLYLQVSAAMQIDKAVGYYVCDL